MAQQSVIIELPEVMLSSFFDIAAAGQGAFVAMTRTIDSSAIIDKPIRIVILQNFTDVFLEYAVSEAGITSVSPQIVLPPQGQLVLDLSSNALQGSGFYIAAGSSIYVGMGDFSTAPTSGIVCASLITAKDV